MRIEWLDVDYNKARVMRRGKVAVIRRESWSGSWVFDVTGHKVGWWLQIRLELSRSHWKNYRAAINYRERRKAEKPLEWVEVPQARLLPGRKEGRA